METRSRSVPRSAWRRIPWRICAVTALALAAAACPCAWLLGQQQQQPGSGEVITDVKVVGNSTVELAKIVPFIKTRAGRPYDGQLVIEDVRRLNRSRMFASVNTENTRDPQGGLVVVYRVVERPTLQYVKYVGLRSAIEKNMEEETNLKIGEPVDPYAVSEGKRKIEEYYKGKGFNLVQVTIVEGTKPTDRGAIYMIHEGPQQQVSKIEFLGNTLATGSRLRTQIQSGSTWFGYFWGYLDLAKVDDDIKTLEKYYKNLGYLTARVGRELDFDPSQTYCTLRFVIDEGPRCQVDSISFAGVTKFRVEDIQKLMKLQTGQPFDGLTLARDRTTVEQIYGSYGYVFADVRAEPRVSEDASHMDLVYVIEEGKRYRVGDIRVQIEGEHPHTNIRTVLNRIELQPGDIVDVRKLRRSEARLQRSQLFAVDPARGVRPQLVIQPAGSEGEELIGGKPKPSGSRSASNSSKPASGASSGIRGQSPDDGDDRWVSVHLVGRANPKASVPQDEGDLPPSSALPGGGYPPPLMRAPPVTPARPAQPLGGNVPFPPNRYVAPRPAPGVAEVVRLQASRNAPNSGEFGYSPNAGEFGHPRTNSAHSPTNSVAPFDGHVPTPVPASRFRSWGAVPTLSP